MSSDIAAQGLFFHKLDKELQFWKTIVEPLKKPSAEMARKVALKAIASLACLYDELQQMNLRLPLEQLNQFISLTNKVEKAVNLTFKTIHKNTELTDQMRDDFNCFDRTAKRFNEQILKSDLDLFKPDAVLEVLRQLPPLTSSLEALLKCGFPEDLMVRFLGLWNRQILHRALRNASLKSAQDLILFITDTPSSNVLAALKERLDASFEEARSKMPEKDRVWFDKQWANPRRTKYSKLLRDGLKLDGAPEKYEAWDHLKWTMLRQNEFPLELYRGDKGELYLTCESPAHHPAVSKIYLRNFQGFDRFTNFFYSPDAKVYYQMKGSDGIAGDSLEVEENGTINSNILFIKNPVYGALWYHKENKIVAHYERIADTSSIASLVFGKTFVPYQSSRVPEYIFMLFDDRRYTERE